ncbi:2-oxoglutarate dehydrogenase E1 component, partial [bacterium]|nr:2-oxoglutarate dehydrogenase E1 component [bacterium]
MPDTVKDRMENSWSYGTNAEYILKIYEDYKNGNPVDSTWKKFFEDHPEFGHPEIYIMPQKFKEAIFQKHSHQPVQTSTHDKDDIIKNIISLYRTDGHRYANINPLINQPAQNKEIIRLIKLLENSLNDSLSASSIEFGSTTTSIQDLLTQLQNTYSHTLSIEASSLETFKQQWCYKTLEDLRNKPLDNEYNTLLWLLERLTAADVFERYLANKYPGVKRFSIEGADALLIALEQIIKTSALVNDTKEIVIGLAHRGRLNVLVNLLGKKASALFEEFDGTAQHAFGTGDVKYHQGFSSEYIINGNTVHITLAFNPSHLEIINPVVVGSALARQHTMSNLNNQQVLPILVHGDSSLSGQGVMMELLNMSKTRGYKVGGSIHIVVNNQIGFTTSNIEDTRSTPYCTDIAKMIRAPVLHVNGDDPIAVYHAAVFAAKWRAEFAEDIFIDLVCYRRLGHNEADEPSVTQPLMYQFIKNHPTPAKIFADKLVEQKIIEESFAEDLKINIRKILDAGHSTNNAVSMTVNSERAKDWKEYLNKPIVNHAQTKVDKNILQKIGADIIDQTKHISLHPRVEKIYQDRAMMYADKKPLDWGAAEMLAYATLLNDGFNVRLSGQDSGRGTFFHRHAVLFDQKTNNATIPLMLLKTNKAQFTVIDSLLSEEAVLSFEYGYATTTPKTL